MKKRAVEKAKKTVPKSKKSKALQSSASRPDGNSRGTKPMKLSDDPRFAQAVQNYEAGLKALQAHKYDRAKACFEKVIAGPSP